MSQKKPSKEIVEQVTAEITEHLSEIEGALLRLDQDPGNSEQIGELFRRIHTIKGISSVLDRPAILEISHRTESFLESVKETGRSLDADDLDLLLTARDLLEKSLSGSEVDLTKFLSLAEKNSKSQESQDSPLPVSEPSSPEEEEENGEAVFLLFRVQGKLCAFPVEKVREISLLLPWRKVPFTSAAFCGMTNLRGQLVPVLKLGALLDLPSASPENGRILFVEWSEELVGCLVDRVVGVGSLPGWDRSVHSLRHFGLEVVEAVSSYRGEVVSVLSSEKLFQLVSASTASKE